jgi:hypothetical protein
MFWTWLFILFMAGCLALGLLSILAWGYKNESPERAADIEEKAEQYRKEVVEPKVEQAIDALSLRVRKARGEDDDEMEKLRQEEARALQELDDLEAGHSSSERIRRLERELSMLQRELAK